MRRVPMRPRAGWQARVEEVGLVFHGGAQPYWHEGACYALTPREVDELEAATNELHRLCLEAASHVIERRRYLELAIPPSAVPLIERSWDEDPPSLYGRFDLVYDGVHPPRLLEYNADTPTALLEAAVVQWYWLQDVHPGGDQFNSIHERLLAAWTALRPALLGDRVHFASLDDAEDLVTATYLRDTAEQAGLATDQLLVGDIGWDPNRARFVDLAERPIATAFKLYPWEWMVGERFGRHLAAARGTTQWIEPAWKMLLSNKGILAILWELFPGHPNLLEAHRDDLLLEAYARKPLLSREGSNVSLVMFGDTLHESAGDYGAEGYVYQALAPLPTFDGGSPVIGSWVIAGESAGIGIRESDGPITTNTSRFVPHLIE